MPEERILPTILDIIAAEHRKLIEIKEGPEHSSEPSNNSSTDQNDEDTHEYVEETVTFNFKPYIIDLVEPLKPEVLNKDPIFLFYKQFIIDQLELL